jgi:hypothetical protein
MLTIKNQIHMWSKKKKKNQIHINWVRFLVVELTHPDSNLRFDMDVTFTINYSFSRRRRPR